MRAVAAVLGLVLAGLIVWGFQQGGGWPEVIEVVERPWGLVTLFDLYVGFFIYAAIVFLVERNKMVALFWAAPIFVLGNVWSIVWLILRAPAIAAAFKTAE